MRKYTNCLKCGVKVSRNCKQGFCNKCRDRTGKNNPFYGKTHKRETINLIKIKTRENSINLWKNESYRKKVTKGTSKPRSEEGKANISRGVKQSYIDNPDLIVARRETMMQRINDGFDPTKGRMDSGEGWGETHFIEGIHCESKLEYKRVKSLLEYGIKVEKWKVATNKPIKYKNNSVTRNYFPDYIVEDEYIEEVKYSYHIDDIVKAKYKAAFIYYKGINKKYYIVTQHDFNNIPEEVYKSYTNVSLRKELNL